MIIILHLGCMLFLPSILVLFEMIFKSTHYTLFCRVIICSDLPGCLLANSSCVEDLFLGISFLLPGKLPLEVPLVKQGLSVVNSVLVHLKIIISFSFLKEVLGYRTLDWILIPLSPNIIWLLLVQLPSIFFLLMFLRSLPLAFWCFSSKHLGVSGLDRLPCSKPMISECE